MIRIPFAKMNGAGNDFVVVDDTKGSFNIDLPAFAKAICARGFGVTADGLLVLRTHEGFDFEMVYLNSDGSEGGMCGNGGRCIARFAVVNGVCGSPMRFLAHRQQYRAEITHHGSVKLHLPDPDQVVPHFKIPFDSRTFDGTYVRPNTEHAVLTSGDAFEKIDEVDIIPFARKIRYNHDVFPNGANVNLIERADDSTIRLRTYERGVENETLACGTGAVASAITAAIRYEMSSPVKIITTGGETLRVYFRRNGNGFSDLVLEGSASMVFSGEVLYDQASGKILDLVDGQEHI